MANYKIVHYMDVVDINGSTARTSFGQQVADAALVSDLATLNGSFDTAFVPATNGKVIRRGCTIIFDEAQLIVGTTPPTSAIYPSVTDGARLNFSNAAGSTSVITVPAPTANTFHAAPSGQTVNPAGDAANLITFLKAHATDQGGNFLNLYQGGVKTGRHARKRPSRKA